MLERQYIPNIITQIDVEGVGVEANSINQLMNILTPPEILSQTFFPRPKIIDCQRYPDFASLLKVREQISHLNLLPIKSELEYRRYHSQSRERLLSIIQSYLTTSPFALAPNLFPYDLPQDVEQQIIWVRGGDDLSEALHGFIAKGMKLLGLSLDEVIIYERSLKTKDHLIRGTMPEFRHLHFWSRLSDCR